MAEYPSQEYDPVVAQILHHGVLHSLADQCACTANAVKPSGLTRPTVVSVLDAAIRAVLREAGPLTLDGLVAELARRRRFVDSKNPRQTTLNALNGDRACARMGDDRHCYLQRSSME